MRLWTTQIGPIGRHDHRFRHHRHRDRVSMSISEADAKRFFERGPHLEVPASLKIDGRREPKVQVIKQQSFCVQSSTS